MPWRKEEAEAAEVTKTVLRSFLAVVQLEAEDLCRPRVLPQEADCPRARPREAGRDSQKFDRLQKEEL